MILWQTRPSIETTSGSWILFPRSTNYISCTARVEFRYLPWLNQIAFIQEIRKTRIVSIPHRMEPLPPERSSVGRSKLAYTRRLITAPSTRTIDSWSVKKKKKERKKGPRKRSQTIENWYSSRLNLDLDVTNGQTENGIVSIDDGEIDDAKVHVLPRRAPTLDWRTVGRSVGRLTRRWLSLLRGWPTGWMAGWFADCMVESLAGTTLSLVARHSSRRPSVFSEASTAEC